MLPRVTAKSSLRDRHAHDVNLNELAVESGRRRSDAGNDERIAGAGLRLTVPHFGAVWILDAELDRVAASRVLVRSFFDELRRIGKVSGMAVVIENDFLVEILERLYLKNAFAPENASTSRSTSSVVL